MKYIDADRLKEAVEKKYNSNDTVGDRWDLGYDTACEQILDIIDSLQQEQPEVDLKKELDKFYGMYRKDGKTYDITDDEEVSDWKEDGNSWFKIEFARHFYNLGLNARKV